MRRGWRADVVNGGIAQHVRQASNVEDTVELEEMGQAGVVGCRMRVEMGND